MNIIFDTKETTNPVEFDRLAEGEIFFCGGRKEMSFLYLKYKHLVKSTTGHNCEANAVSLEDFSAANVLPSEKVLRAKHELRIAGVV